MSVIITPDRQAIILGPKALNALAETILSFGIDIGVEGVDFYNNGSGGLGRIGYVNGDKASFNQELAFAVQMATALLPKAGQAAVDIIIRVQDEKGDNQPYTFLSVTEDYS